MILFNHLGYSLITSNGVCRHVNGMSPLTNCLKSGLSQSSCEVFCTSLTSCVGYFFKASSSKCWLLPSESRCPSDFRLYRLTFAYVVTLARSKNDLVAYPIPGYVCYGKNSGKTFEHDWQIYKDLKFIT